MATRDQQRAQMAWEHVQSVTTQNEKQQKRYGSTVHGLPALIRNAGLSQALHFVLSRKHDEAKKVLQHLAAQLKRVDARIDTQRDGGVDGLLDSVRKADLGMYLRLTQEALACVNWYKRFVQGVLGVEASDEGDDRG
jgi:CRISPR-associated protein Cmr5